MKNFFIIIGFMKKIYDIISCYKVHLNHRENTSVIEFQKKIQYIK